MKDRLPNSVFEYSERWTGKGISKDSITDLCKEVERRLRGIIESQMQEMASADPLEEEITRHLNHGADLARSLHGRVKEIEHVREYLRGTESSPLVLIGPPGSGKSTLLGHVAEQLGSIVPKAKAVIRFIGSSPESSEPMTLVSGICQQISLIYGESNTASNLSLGQMGNDLQLRLDQVSPEQPLILILDGFDHLAGPLAGEVGWLPNTLPAGVRLILSLRVSSILATAISSYLSIHLNELNPIEAEAILDQQLTEERRSLRPEQRTDVLRSFEMNRLPVYVRLISKEACRWKSYTPTIELPKTAEELVRSELTRLAREENHGSVIVERVLACIAAAKNGLAEDELLDLLTVPSVMSDFRRRSPNSPHISLLPPVVWARLYADLTPYLEELIIDNTRLITFNNPFIGDVVVRDYLSGENSIRYHLELADYFRAQRFYLEPHGSSNKIPNYRVLSELPWHLLESKQYEKLAELLTDLQFLDSAENSGRAREIMPYLTELKFQVPIRDYFMRAFESLDPGKCNYGLEFVGPGVAILNNPAGSNELSARRINDMVIRYLRPLFEPYELIPFLEEAIKIAIKTTRPGVQVLRNNLGCLLLEAGKVDQANTQYTQATEEDDISIRATSLHGQGMIALQLEDLDKAEKLLKEALRLHKSVPGPYSIGVAEDLAGLGMVAEQQGSLTEAESLYRLELSEVEHGLGSTHIRTIEAHRRLAWIYRKIGDLKRAEHHYRWTIRWGRIALGDRYLQVQLDRLFLGIVLCSGERFEEAWRVLNEIWELDPQALDKVSPPSKADSFLGVANVLRDEKRLSEAQSVMHHALKILDKDDTATDAQRINCMEPLIDLLVNMGQIDEALPLFRRGLAYTVRQFGYDHEQSVIKRKRVRAAESILNSHPGSTWIECVFCGIESELNMTSIVDYDEYACPTCGGLLCLSSLIDQPQKELVSNSSIFLDQHDQWFLLRGLPFSFYVRIQCKSCKYEATHYTRRSGTGPGKMCPKCGHTEQTKSTSNFSQNQGSHTPSLELKKFPACDCPWGQKSAGYKCLIATCDACGHIETWDAPFEVDDEMPDYCPGCGYNGTD